MSLRSLADTLLLVTLSTACLFAGAKRPNVLFIMADQHRADCLGAAGNKFIRTPQLDRLAARSALFTNAFVQSPVCVPSRASFFTGRYPHSHKNRVNYTPIAKTERLMPAIFRAAGYATALVGKTHIYYEYPPTADAARDTGFEIVELHDGIPATDKFSAYVAWRDQHDPQAAAVKNYRMYAKNVEPGRNPFRAVIDDAYTDTTWTGQTTRRHLQAMSAGERPFFIFCSFWKPHSPYEVPVPFDRMYDDVQIPLPAPTTLDDIRRLPEPLQKLILRGKPEYDMPRDELEWIYRSYYASITQVDREVGLILDLLEKLGKADDTVIVYSADHGDQLLEHGLTGKNTFFEASVRVPYIVGYPEHFKPGKYDELVEAVDVLPTLLETCRIDSPPGVQGRSLVPLLGTSDRAYKPREAVFSENIIPEVITGGRMEMPYVAGQGVAGIRHPDAKMVRTDRWKFNYYANGQVELYDLKNDPGETTNLAYESSHAATVAEMRGRLLEWLITADEQDQIAPRWLKF
ncbi:MAG TPA: sulfatase-like hydrolase/transferase [Pirellulales bacterium]|jgi:choline-sulfatase|nr:sulfatase-like hydrolase/transferase [Pirellulales bacterium]